MLEMRSYQIVPTDRGEPILVNQYGDKSGTQICGISEDVKKLKQALVDYTTNPQNYQESLKVDGISFVSAQFVRKLKDYLFEKYQTIGKTPGQLLEVEKN